MVIPGQTKATEAWLVNPLFDLQTVQRLSELLLLTRRCHATCSQAQLAARTTNDQAPEKRRRNGGSCDFGSRQPIGCTLTAAPATPCSPLAGKRGARADCGLGCSKGIRNLSLPLQPAPRCDHSHSTAATAVSCSNMYNAGLVAGKERAFPATIARMRSSALHDALQGSFNPSTQSSSQRCQGDAISVVRQLVGLL